MSRTGYAEKISVTDDYGRGDQQEQGQGEKRRGAGSRAFPLFEANAPKGAEDDDTGHVQRPTREAIAAHLALTHRVEEELEVPGGARKGAEEIIAEHRCLYDWRRGGFLDQHGGGGGTPA